MVIITHLFPSFTDSAAHNYTLPHRTLPPSQLDIVILGTYGQHIKCLAVIAAAHPGTTDPTVGGYGQCSGDSFDSSAFLLPDRGAAF